MTRACCSCTACSHQPGGSPRLPCCTGCSGGRQCSWGRYSDQSLRHRHDQEPHMAHKLCSRGARSGSTLAGRYHRPILQHQACTDTGLSCRRIVNSQSRSCCSGKARSRWEMLGSSIRACSGHRRGQRHWVCRGTAPCFRRTLDLGIRGGHNHTICSHPEE